MNFSSLRRLIESADEKQFYDVALYFLTAQGYKDLAIVDGPYDGGRDVVCSRHDLNIQLSVQKKWQDKIVKEARGAIEKNKKHLIFITNKLITQRSENDFRASFPLKGEIEVSIYDANKLASGLVLPSRLGRAYKILGIEVKPKVVLNPKEVALSNLLLFGDEAQELRERVVDATLATWLRDNPDSSEDRAIAIVASQIPGASTERLVKSAISRLRTKGGIQGSASGIRLSKEEAARIDAAEGQLVAAKAADCVLLSQKFGLENQDAEELIGIAIELLSRTESAGWSSEISEVFNGFIAEHKLTKKRDELYKFLSDMDTIKITERVKTIDRVFSTNTFDIHRALGGKAEIQMVLDASVALPMMCGLEFGLVRSRWSSAAANLKELADAHAFPILLPRPYLNEMASHGLKALQYDEIYQAFSPELRRVLRESRNAYISHYARIVDDQGKVDGEELSLLQFLSSFGISAQVSVKRVEDRIESLLDRHGISSVWGSQYDPVIRERFRVEKPSQDLRLVEHDAAVCTKLKELHDTGSILATWDRVVIEVVQDLAKIYADRPSRIVDWLSFIQGIETGIDGSLSVVESLLLVEEAAIRKLAARLDRIQNAEQAYKLSGIIDSVRADKGSRWMPDAVELDEMLHVELDDLVGPVGDNEQPVDVESS